MFRSSWEVAEHVSYLLLLHGRTTKKMDLTTRLSFSIACSSISNEFGDDNIDRRLRGIEN